MLYIFYMKMNSKLLSITIVVSLFVLSKGKGKVQKTNLEKENNEITNLETENNEINNKADLEKEIKAFDTEEKNDVAVCPYCQYPPEGETITVLCCSHIFCKDCFDKDKAIRNSIEKCPICGKNIDVCGLCKKKIVTGEIYNSNCCKTIHCTECYKRFRQYPMCKACQFRDQKYTLILDFIFVFIYENPSETNN
ncbi:uncharacterized protein LOC126897287 isoform X2 [Daktulosphaira vitifoliae]|uniref:uncharacterized protein LOC126897287 isoform X2 n=1 Tax=Daktulosphaira vitifoliae TaxID=58002 RepID=UPI0021AA7FC4|nr:uncharacterized protein LOC126897287 isoform X2 [Daktulosphaira vitifoliae]